MDLGLKDHVALVTGGGSGIGRATALALVAEGARVASLDMAFPEHARDCLQVPCDVRSPEEVRVVVKDTAKRLGRVDHLVVCAGIARDRVLWKLADDDWQAVLDVNLTGAFRAIAATAPIMRAGGGGSIVTVSSINGLRGKFGQASYSASKAGLIGLTKAAAKELGAFGIRVNAVAPGMVRTPMTAGLSDEVVAKAKEESLLGRISDPEDIAHAILYLLSDAARNVTGEVLKVDAGQYV